MLKRKLKRCADLSLSVAGLLGAGPILVAASVAILATDGPPIMFRQLRPGLRGQPFRLVKFKTMAAKVDASGAPLPDEVRLTKLGRVLRATSIDELPQLWNVLRGDMSLVGPRPLLMQYLSRYSPEQARRHEVPPGITGWAQVHGRNALTWDEKFALDVWYVDHWSLWLDAKILALTALRVLKRSGISNPNHATMPEFMGNQTP